MDALMKLCVQTATAHGVPTQTAKACNDYSVGCPDCPFAPDKDTPVIGASDASKNIHHMEAMARVSQK